MTFAWLLGVLDAESVPQVAPEQPAPVRVKVVPALAESFTTVTVKDCVPVLEMTEAVVGLIPTAIPVLVPEPNTAEVVA